MRSDERAHTYTFESEVWGDENEHEAQILVTVYERQEDHPIGRGEWRLVGVDVAVRPSRGAVWGPPLRQVDEKVP